MSHERNPIEIIRMCALEIHARTGADIDDLMSAGSVAYVLAERSFDPKRGEWLTRICCHVRWAMLDDVRRSKGRKRSREARERFASEYGERVDDRTPERLLMHAELQPIVRRAVSTLPPIEAALLVDVDMGEQTISDVAASFGLSKAWGSRLHKRARKRVARRLHELAPGILP